MSRGVAAVGRGRVVLALAVLGLACGGCGRERSRAGSPGSGGSARTAAGSGSGGDAAGTATSGDAAGGAAAGPAAGGGAAGGDCALERATWRHPAADRVIAFGDVHGDQAAVQRVLRGAGVVDDAGRWTGGATWVVQLGDVLDRGDDEQAIIDWFERLEGEAAAAGGRFIWLLGNHELMNPAGDFRYVTEGGFRDFEDVSGLDLARFAAVPEVARARAAALAPGGPYARILAGQNLVAVVGDTAFVHGGIVPGVPATLDEVNHAARCWLAGHGPPPSALHDDHGPVWDRSAGGERVDCDRLGRALDELGVTRLVVAHTVQPDGISSACKGRVWRVDVGLARAYGGPSEALEIAGGKTRVVRGR